MSRNNKHQTNPNPFIRKGLGLVWFIKELFGTFIWELGVDMKRGGEVC